MSALGARLLVLGLISLTTVTSGCQRSSSASEDPAKDAAVPKSVMHLDPFVVNLADSEDNRFLRVGIDLGLENASAKDAKGDGRVPTALVRDCILEVLSTWHSQALLAPDGKQKLRDEILKALQARAPELGAKEVYFTDFLVQR